MAKITLYHNKNCGTSNKVLAALRDAKVDVEVVEYLKTPLTKAQLAKLVDTISDAPADLVRKDPKFKALGLDAGDYTTKTKVVALLAKHPELMQRPVLVKGTKGFIARPADRVSDIL